MTTTTAPTETIRETSDLPPWRALPVLVAGVFLVVLDFFIVNVAMPSIQQGIGADASQLEWVVAGYGLTLASFLLTAGRIGDGVGRRRMFSLGVAVFTVTSLLCALATTPELLIIARLVQGLGAAMIMTSMLSLIGVLFQGPDRARAISVYGMVMGVAAAGGQIIGGALIQADVLGLGWRAIFLINVPVGLGIIAMAPRLIPESRADHPARLDPVGLILLTATVTTLILPLIDGQQAGWPVWSWCVLALSALLLASTVWQQRRLAGRGGTPLFPPELLSVRTFRIGLVLQLVYWCGQASFYLFLALYLQSARGLSALDSGLMFSALAVAYLATSMNAPSLVESHGRRVVALGAVTIAVGHLALLAALAAGTSGSLWLLIPGLMAVGAGQGWCITPLASIVLAHVEPAQAGTVTGALSTTQQVGNCLGVAIIGVIFFGVGPGSTPAAFGWSLVALIGVSSLVVALGRLLPRPVGNRLASIENVEEAMA
jgi:EmrB/QacA subfamily drug resistance transporter